MTDIITFRGGREAPEGLDWVRDQIDRLDGQEPEHMGTEEHGLIAKVKVTFRG